MKDQNTIRNKIEAIDKDWDAANDIWEHYGANPEVGAIVATLEWVLDEEDGDEQ